MQAKDYQALVGSIAQGTLSILIKFCFVEDMRQDPFGFEFMYVVRIILCKIGYRESP